MGIPNMDLYLRATSENVGVLDGQSQAGARYQVGHHSQRFARAVISVSRCQFGEPEDDRFR